MTTQMIICLAIFLFMIIGFVFYNQLKLSMGATSLITILLVAFTGLMETADVLKNFANQNVLLSMSMFVVAAGFSRTQAVKKVSGMVYKISGGSFTKMMAGYLLLAALLAQMIPSPMAVFGIVFPLVVGMCDDLDISPSKAMFSLGLVGVGSYGTLPLGNGMTAYAKYNGFLEAYGYGQYQMGVLDMFIGRFPIMVAIILYSLFLAPKLAPAKPPVPIAGIQVSKKGGKEAAPLGPVREFLGYFVFLMTAVALIFQSRLGIPSWMIAMTGATVMVASGVLTTKEAINALPIKIALMLISALVIGGAMDACGLGDLIGQTIAGIMGNSHNNYMLGAIFFILPFVLTQVMQNASVLNIFMPLLILSCKALECNPIGPIILCYAACCTAFMTPMATGTVPMMMDAGGYDQVSLIKQGLLPSVFICVVAIFWIMTVFPAF